MWREDDFEDKGRQVKAVPADKPGEFTNDSDHEPEGKAERPDGRGKELSHNARSESLGADHLRAFK